VRPMPPRKGLAFDLAALTERVVRSEAAGRVRTVRQFRAHVEALRADIRAFCTAMAEPDRQARRGKARGRPS